MTFGGSLSLWLLLVTVAAAVDGQELVAPHSEPFNYQNLDKRLSMSIPGAEFGDKDLMNKMIQIRQRNYETNPGRLIRQIPEYKQEYYFTGTQKITTVKRRLNSSQPKKTEANTEGPKMLKITKGRPTCLLKLCNYQAPYF